MALGDDKTDNTQDFFYLNKLEIAERMYKICIFVIVLGLGAPMVSLRVFVQEKATVRTTRHTTDLPGPPELFQSIWPQFFKISIQWIRQFSHGLPFT